MTIAKILMVIAEVVLIAYLIGSIPTGYIIVKLFKGIDIRTVGSGSTGATNVKRVMGNVWFFVVMVLDALKGALAVWIAFKYFNIMGEVGELIGLTPVIAGCIALLGHSRSIFLKFTGGKSVATAVGTLIALCPPVGGLVILVWAVITVLTRYVSLGSICAVASAPILMNLFHQGRFSIWYAAVGAIYVVLRHKDNIKRLFEGKEDKITWSSPKESK